MLGVSFVATVRILRYERVRFLSRTLLGLEIRNWDTVRHGCVGFPPNAGNVREPGEKRATRAAPPSASDQKSDTRHPIVCVSKLFPTPFRVDAYFAGSFTNHRSSLSAGIIRLASELIAKQSRVAEL